jgi:hypothetical protein
MYALDTGDLCDRELEKSVADWCSQFGTVTCISTLNCGAGRTYAVVHVRMSAAVDPQKILLCIADPSADIEALIVLDQ